MITILMTGNIGAGKSSASHYLRESGIAVIDADVLASIVMRKRRYAIADIVGRQILINTFPHVDRKAIGKVIFSDVEKRKLVEGVVHPEVHNMFLQLRMLYKDSGSDIVAYDVPLLFEAGYDRIIKADHVVIIDTEVEIRRERVMKYRGYTAEQFNKVNDSQLSTHQKLFIKKDCLILPNNEGLTQLNARLHSIMNYITKLTL